MWKLIVICSYFRVTLSIYNEFPNVSFITIFFNSFNYFSFSVKNSGLLLDRKSLINFFKTLTYNNGTEQNLVTVGLVGYPNVGKSSTINALIQDKKTSVSATPGKTKHFQVCIN